MRKIYNGVIEPDREPDFIWRDDIKYRSFSFWFDESIVKYTIINFHARPIYSFYNFRRIEKKTGPRYQYNSKDFGWTSLTGVWITSYANKVIREIEQARNRWIAAKALEEVLK